MVTKYIILSDGKSKEFKTPRQLSIINDEPIIKRTIRLLKENGIEDILITSHDKRFDNFGVARYEPLYNDWDNIKKTGYWLSAFPIELLNEPVCFLFGDVYYSENAINMIVNTPTESTLFFCSYENKDKRYIKKHDEPLAYKVVDYKLFKKHINIVKGMKDKGECCREPIVWELYRSINGQDINVHEMTKNYVVINDESCDIDTTNDIILLNKKLGGIEMIKVEALQDFTLARFDEIENIERAGKNLKGYINKNDKFECEKELCDYLLGENPLGKAVVKVIEVIPAKVEIKEEPKEIIEEEKPKTTKKKKTSKK